MNSAADLRHKHLHEKTGQAWQKIIAEALNLFHSCTRRRAALDITNLTTQPAPDTRKSMPWVRVVTLAWTKNRTTAMKVTRAQKLDYDSAWTQDMTRCRCFVWFLLPIAWASLPRSWASRHFEPPLPSFMESSTELTRSRSWASPQILCWNLLHID